MTDILDNISNTWLTWSAFAILYTMYNHYIYLDFFDTNNRKILVLCRLDQNYERDDNVVVKEIKESSVNNRNITSFYKRALTRTNDKVTCPLCLDDVTKDNPKPLIVTNSCHHLFCLDCYYRMVKDSETNGKSQQIILGRLPSCPFCRMDTFISYDVNICTRMLRAHLIN